MMGEHITEDEKQLAHVIHRTIRYFDIFEQPVTATTIWRNLMVDEIFTSSRRWDGHAVWPLREVQRCLDSSPFLASRVDSKWGYYVLQGKTELVHQRLRKFCLAQDKWKLTRRVARWLQYVPGVRMLAVSGSLAQAHTSQQSDLDIFVITRPGFIWLTRLGVLLVTQLSGRRRKYWDQRAPDKVCLNHYLTESSLRVPLTIRNAYTAVLYHSLIPMTGLEAAEKFWRTNADWMRRSLMYPEAPLITGALYLSPSRFGLWWQRQGEALLAEPMFSWLEGWAEKVQRRQIAKHTKPGQQGRVVLSARELAFHPDTKVPGILNQLAQDQGQARLL